MKKPIVILSLSGGMDSTSLLIHFLAKGFEVKALSFNYGQKHKIELVKVQENLKYLKEKGYEIEHNIIDLSILGKLYNSALTSSDIAVPEGHYAEENMKATVVPNRNAIFSSIIYGYALSIAEKTGEKVYISLGIHAGDHDIYPDCRQEFRDAINYAFKIGNWGSEKIEYVTPFINYNKADILKGLEGDASILDLNPIQILENTNTCYQPNKKGEACGKCGSCVERIEAFDKICWIDPIKYVTDWDTVVENALLVSQKK